MRCPKCSQDTKVKNGIKYGRQRYKCRNCGCHYTRDKLRGASLGRKLEELRWYLEGSSFRSIGRCMGVSNTTVLNWIRTFGESVKTYVNTHMINDARHIDFIEIDEMWHFTLKKNENSGSGLLSIGILKKSLGSLSKVEVKKPIKN